ncbi:hypothetical protein ACQZ4Y_08860 [Rhizobium sp. L80/93]|uniref:hypothetical protein n=1 Tax=Rhizobium sp. E27B/91 TaxID=2819995 RepID=UPI001FFDFB8E|nr:hypothetical protein [Rhizobium sp. E27B/91]
MSQQIADANNGTPGNIGFARTHFGGQFLRCLGYNLNAALDGSQDQKIVGDRIRLHILCGRQNAIDVFKNVQQADMRTLR